MILEIDEYERDNLVWALDLIATRHEFALMNSGDWVRQIWAKLDVLPAGPGPNLSKEKIIKILEGRAKCQKEMQPKNLKIFLNP